MRNEQYVPQLTVRSNVKSGQGGWVGGVWYPDMSGVCGPVTPPTPTPPTPTPPTPTPPTGGGWVGGVWYADRSGICG